MRAENPEHLQRIAHHQPGQPAERTQQGLPVRDGHLRVKPNQRNRRQKTRKARGKPTFRPQPISALGKRTCARPPTGRGIIQTRPATAPQKGKPPPRPVPGRTSGAGSAPKIRRWPGRRSYGAWSPGRVPAPLPREPAGGTGRNCRTWRCRRPEAIWRTRRWEGASGNRRRPHP